jgi:hypothetical protein
VVKAKNDGRIEVDENGRIPDADVADRQWDQRTDQTRFGADVGTAPSRLRKSRADLAATGAELAELELSERKAQLVDAAAVRRKLRRLVETVIRPRLRELPDRLATDLSLEASRRLAWEIDELFDEVHREVESI